MLNKKISIVASFRNEEKILHYLQKEFMNFSAKYTDLDYEIVFIMMIQLINLKK